MKRPKINDYPKKIDGKCQYYHDDLEKYKICYCKLKKMPTNKEKRNLPFDVRKLYCQSVDIHQQITYYELDIITEKVFVEEVRKIVKKYKAVKETSALLP